MIRTLTVSFLLLTCTVCSLAQSSWLSTSARQIHLKGKVHTVLETCSFPESRYQYRYEYEFARDGKLISFSTSPQLELPICIIPSLVVTEKITKRNSRGDIEEIAHFIGDSLISKDRYEFEYDSLGNWVKRLMFFVRFNAPGRGAEPEWQAVSACQRMVEYYPDKQPNKSLEMTPR